MTFFRRSRRSSQLLLKREASNRAMFRRIDDFIQAWNHEAESSLKLFRTLTDTSLSQSVYEGGRTLGGIAWHITQTPREMLGRTGLEIEGPAEHGPIPNSASEIADEYQRTAHSVAEQVTKEWTDETLN